MTGNARDPGRSEGTTPLGPLDELYRGFARERRRRNYHERMADPVRAARWRAQKRQWWREHRAKWPVTVRVAP